MPETGASLDAQAAPAPRLRLGVSSCLLGERVRFNGDHKRDRFVTDVLSRYIEWVPVCPEFEMGLGAPRESMRLVGDPADPRLIAPASGTDHTAAMKRFVRARLRELTHAGLHGFIVKKDSPTCGMTRVRVWHAGGGGNERKGTGLFTGALMDRLSLLPVEEEGRLHDPRLRENFIERVFAYYRWSEFLGNRPRRRDLVHFHTTHKLSLRSHGEKQYRELGRLVADLKGRPLRETLATYGNGFMATLRVLATPSKHANVLYHMLGYLKRALDGADRRELAERIEEYRNGRVPLVVPLTLFQHHFRRHPVDWIAEQTYLAPYPAELMLRNRV
ncbi:MAG: YbgA family protein [Planctomycetota bacterium]|jgi:uncharacterized protein YbgA (DUF1722 family)/uncharacterized protein YbbK (DUF523 family)